MRFRLSASLLCLIAAASTAVGGPISSSPRPVPRPTIISVPPMTAAAPARVQQPRHRPGTIAPIEAVPEASGSTTVAMTHSVLTSPYPRPRPDRQPRPTLVAAGTMRTQLVPELAPGRKGAVCGDPAIKGQSIPPVAAKLKGCGLKDGVEVTSIAGVKLSEAATIDCDTARALKTWVESTVIPTVGTQGGGIEGLQVAASYVCRPRNNQKGNRVSEHGRGRAVDVAAIILENGAVISVLKDWGQGRYGKILKNIRKAACGPFNTVLGPGSDKHHRDHLHLDTAHGRGPYCR